MKNSNIPLFKNKFFVNSRKLNTVNKATLVRDNFIEWLRGFTDAEGCFYLAPHSPDSLNFSFSYSISVHIDDIQVLGYIQQSLQMGNIRVTRGMATFKVTKQEDIKKILEIFSKAPLNSIKQLNFLAFKKAFELYINNKSKDLSLKLQMDNIRDNMNSNRTDYSWPDRKIRISPYWLLGFVEGDGSFSVILRNISTIFLRFIISQSRMDLFLLKEIQKYLNNLAVVKGLIKSGRTYSNPEDFTHISNEQNLEITNSLFICYIIIPFFNDLTFRSKKWLDYKDWRTIFKLRENGHHYNTECWEVIKLIFSQMNNRRLSTYKEKESLNMEVLQSKIEKFLNGPSNYENREGRIWVKSLNKYYSDSKAVAVQMLDLNGLVLKSWSTITECANSLNITRGGVQKRLKNNTKFTLEGRTCVLKKIEKDGVDLQ